MWQGQAGAAQFETADWTVVAERKRLLAGAHGEEVPTDDVAGSTAAWQFNAQMQCFGIIVMYCRHADLVAVVRPRWSPKLECWLTP